MSIIGEIKVGDKIKPTNPSTWSITYGEAEVKAIAKNDSGREIVWMLVAERGSGIRIFNTFSMLSLKDQWERAPQFFKIGRRYSSSAAWNVGAVYHIQELYLLDNPETDGDKSTAVAKVTKADGCQYITTLNSFDFKNMKEIV